MNADRRYLAVGLNDLRHSLRALPFAPGKGQLDLIGGNTNEPVDRRINYENTLALLGPAWTELQARWNSGSE